MPKAAINKHNGFVARQHNVWTAWKGGYVFAKSISAPMQERTQQEFGRGIPPSNAGHIAASTFWGLPINQTNAFSEHHHI